MSNKYLLLTIPFLMLSCKQEVRNTESRDTSKNIPEQEKIETGRINKELTEQKRKAPLNLNAEREGVYSYCVPDERTDEFKSVTCYEISIFKDEVTVDGNTSFCTGIYNMTGNKEEIELSMLEMTVKIISSS